MKHKNMKISNYLHTSFRMLKLCTNCYIYAETLKRINYIVGNVKM